jgi:hypothetical protein
LPDADALARPCGLLFVFALISVKAEDPQLEVVGFCGTIPSIGEDRGKLRMVRNEIYRATSSIKRMEDEMTALSSPWQTSFVTTGRA